ncbi:hypothetical protein [Tissierella sp.]|uniref:hypothetical protein n=1 Tax=Tissierella sp. TaxID=41274 RepID=UPI0030340753
MYNVLQYQFNNSLERYGYNVKVNAITDARVIFKEYEEGASTTDYKYMLVANGLINQGDIIEVFNENWFVLGKNVSINDVYTKFVIRRLKFNINFNFAGEVIVVPSAIDEGTYRLTGDTIVLQDGRIVLFIQENKQSRRITVEQRFIIMGNAWKVIQKTNTEKGIYKIYADIDTFSHVDDRENEIVDRWKYESKNNYIVKINNTVLSPLTLSSTLQLDVTVTNNGEIVEVPLTYTSSDASILTVDAGGLVTCVGVGTTNITVAVTEDLTVMDTIVIVVEEEPPVESITYTIIGQPQYQSSTDDKIFTKEWCKYAIHKFVDGVEVEGNFTFEIDNTKLATLSEITNNSVKVTAKDVVKGGDIKLVVTDTDTGQVAIEKTITIKGW